MPEVRKLNPPRPASAPAGRAVWWIALAACAGHDPEIWFDALRPREAKRICAACPVRKQCLAAFGDEEYGIYGGLTPKERGTEEWRRG